MIKNIPYLFEYIDYKKFINACIRDNKEHVRALKSELSRACGCQLAYFSQVLNGDAHLSMEQAEALATYLFRAEEEIDYFLDLVMFNRSSKDSLRKRLKSRIQKVIDEKENLKNRVPGENKIKEEEGDPVYLSTWHYAAIHTAIGIKKYQSIQALSRLLGLSYRRCDEIVKYLYFRGYIVRSKSGFYESSDVTVHIPKDSPWLHVFLSNLSQAAMEQLHEKRKSRFHYSAFATMDEESYLELKQMLIQVVDRFLANAKSKNREDLYLINLGFFEMKEAQ